jgi:hypothetical protein
VICSHSAFFDAGPADDPLIVRLDDFLEVGVGEDALWRIRPCSENYGIRQDVALPSEAWLSSSARRYSLKAAQAKRKSFFFSLPQQPSSSPTYWLFYADAGRPSQNEDVNSFLKRAQLDQCGELAGVAFFMIHAIVFAAVALFALIGALTA